MTPGGWSARTATDSNIITLIDNAMAAELLFRMISPGFGDDRATPRESGVARSLGYYLT